MGRMRGSLQGKGKNACKEKDGKEEAVEGRGDVVPTEGEQRDVDRRCEHSTDSLPPHYSLKTTVVKNSKFGKYQQKGAE